MITPSSFPRALVPSTLSGKLPTDSVHLTAERIFRRNFKSLTALGCPNGDNEMIPENHPLETTVVNY
jgi:hypothetical protein